MGWRVLSPRMMICCQPFRMMVDWRKPVLKITLQPVCSTPAFTHKIFYFWIIPPKSTRQVLLRTSAQKHKTREQKGQCLLRAAHEERPLITISELFCSTGKQGTGLKCSLLSLVCPGESCLQGLVHQQKDCLLAKSLMTPLYYQQTKAETIVSGDITTLSN